MLLCIRMHDDMDVHVQTYCTKLQPCLGHALVPKHDLGFVGENVCVAIPIFESCDMDTGRETFSQWVTCWPPITWVGGVSTCRCYSIYSSWAPPLATIGSRCFTLIDIQTLAQ